MCSIDQLLRNLAVDARHADIEARPQKEGAAVEVQTSPLGLVKIAQDES